MVLYELMTMGIPFQGMSVPEVRKAVLAGISPRLSSDEEERYGMRLVSLFRRCCAFEPDERPSMVSVEAELVSMVAEQMAGNAAAFSVLSLSPGSAASLKDTMYALSALAGPQQRRATTVPLSSHSADGDTPLRSTSMGLAYLNSFGEHSASGEWPVTGTTKSAPSSPRRVSIKSASFLDLHAPAGASGGGSASKFSRVPSQPSPPSNKGTPVRKSYSQSKLSLNLSKISKSPPADHAFSPRSKTTPNSPQDSPARDGSPRSVSNPDSPSGHVIRWPSQPASTPPPYPSPTRRTESTKASGSKSAREVPEGKPAGFLSFFSEADIVEMNAQQFLRPKGRR